MKNYFNTQVVNNLCKQVSVQKKREEKNLLWDNKFILFPPLVIYFLQSIIWSLLKEEERDAC